MSRYASLLVCGLMLLGCGSKSGLGAPAPAWDSGADTGVDSGIDSGIDSGFIDTGIDADECVELPFEEPPHQVSVNFLARIFAADVLFLIDTTGSMGGEIDQIRSTLRDTLVPAMADAIGDVRFSVASLADFPVSPFGDSSDQPFQLIQASTHDVAAVQAAVDRLPMRSGNDGPESQVEALYQVATGEGIGRYVLPARCPGGTVGYPCFRSDGSRIILLFTDAAFHNGPTGLNPYDVRVRPRAHTYAEARDAIVGMGAKVLGLFSGNAAQARADLTAIARDSGAIAPDGSPIFVDIGTDGSRLGIGVIDSIRTLVDEVPIDIDLIVEDMPGDTLDARDFVAGIVAVRASPASGAVVRGDRFDRVRPDTQVFFTVRLQNNILPPATEPRSYLMRIVLRGDRVIRLHTTVVHIVIPGIRGETCATLPR